MAGQALQSFQAFLEAKDMNCQVSDDEKMIRLGMGLDGTHISIYLSFDDDDKNVNIEGRDFVSIPSDKYDMVYKICNDLNSKYRFIKFLWYENSNEMIAMTDAVIDLETSAEECFELVMRMAGIVENAYPQIMKSLWA